MPLKMVKFCCKTTLFLFTMDTLKIYLRHSQWYQRTASEGQIICSTVGSRIKIRSSGLHSKCLYRGASSLALVTIFSF